MSDPEQGPERGRRKISWAAVLVILGGAIAAYTLTRGPKASAAPEHPRVAEPVRSGVVPVEVNARGFFPSSVRIAAGTTVDLELTRTTEDTCASAVSVPELGITKDLPLREPVRVTLPAEHERTLALQCGVGDHRSAVIIQ